MAQNVTVRWAHLVLSQLPALYSALDPTLDSADGARPRGGCHDPGAGHQRVGGEGLHLEPRRPRNVRETST